MLEGDKKITLDKVWAVSKKLRSYLESSDANYDEDEEGLRPLVSNMKQIGITYYKKNENDFNPTMEHKIATFLNPTMKKLNAIDDLTKAEILNNVKQMVPKKKEFLSKKLTKILYKIMTLIA